MSIRIIDETPDPEVIKRVSCCNCGVNLEYVPIDVQERIRRDYTGDAETIRFITCPKCNKEVTVK